MTNGLRIRFITLVGGLSLWLAAGCGSGAQPPDEEVVQAAALTRFLALRDTLALQHIVTCDSLQPAMIQRKVDSLVMDYFQRNDTISLDMGAYGDQ